MRGAVEAHSVRIFRQLHGLTTSKKNVPRLQKGNASTPPGVLPGIDLSAPPFLSVVPDLLTPRVPS